MGHVKHRYEPYACHMRWISFFSAGTIGTSGAMARMVGQDLHVAAPTIHVVHLLMRACTAGHQLMVTAGLLGPGMLTKWGGGGGALQRAVLWNVKAGKSATSLTHAWRHQQPPNPWYP